MRFFVMLVFMAGILCCLPAWAADGADGAKLQKVTLMLHWTPQAQFAGYYMAKEKGIYAKNGLDVEILHADMHNSNVDAIKSGKVDFITLFLASGIKYRANGLDIVNVAQISQRSALLLIAKKSSGINTLNDLNGKKLGIWKADFQEIPEAFLKNNNINMKVVNFLGGVNLLRHDGVDVMTGMWYNEYHTLITCGINPDEMTTFALADYKMNIPEDGIYCTKSFYERDPVLCRKFVNASIDGWLYAMSHQQETLKIVEQKMLNAHCPYSLAHQRWMLEKVELMIFPDKNNRTTGFLEKSVYQQTAEILLKAGTIKEIPPYGSFYINLQDGKNVQK